MLNLVENNSDMQIRSDLGPPFEIAALAVSAPVVIVSLDNRTFPNWLEWFLLIIIKLAIALLNDLDVDVINQLPVNFIALSLIIQMLAVHQERIIFIYLVTVCFFVLWPGVLQYLIAVVFLLLVAAWLVILRARTHQLLASLVCLLSWLVFPLGSWVDSLCLISQ